ncbi:MAG: TetR family transcriptional regulator [Butyricicoccus sp.]
MTSRSDSMDQRLADCFKMLLREHPFEKITIQMIAEQTGIIRSTFYRHFKDKQDLMDWIIQRELIEPAAELIQRDQIIEALRKMLSTLFEDGAFYRRAMLVTGQNGFFESVYHSVSDLMYHALSRHGITDIPQAPILNARVLANYYANSFVYAMTLMLSQNLDQEYSVEQMMEAYCFMAEHSPMEILFQQRRDDLFAGE